jgi:hypothetical protein
MNQQAPDHTTHTPVKVVVPTEEDVIGIERDRLPTPSLWQEGVQVSHRHDASRKGIVRRVEYVTRQFRLVGAARTMWESFDNWIVLVEKSAAEKAKDEAREVLASELALLDADDLAAVEVLCDDPDPTKGLAKLNAMRKLGIIGGSPAAKGKK